MAGSHQHPLLQSSEQEYGSPVAVLKFAAQAASGRLGRRLLELHIGGDGACSILPVSSSSSRRRRCLPLALHPTTSFLLQLEESSALYCGGLLSNIYCGSAQPDEVGQTPAVAAMPAAPSSTSSTTGSCPPHLCAAQAFASACRHPFLPACRSQPPTLWVPARAAAS